MFIRVLKSLSFMLETGYRVISLPVMAFKKVLREPLDNTSKGLFTGKFLEPFNTECSRIWGVPASDSVTVLKEMQKVLFTSSFDIFNNRAPERSCWNKRHSASTSLTKRFSISLNPDMTSPVCGCAITLMARSVAIKRWLSFGMVITSSYVVY